MPEAAGVERGALDRPGQQRTQAISLVGGEPVSIPVQALQLGHQPRGELGLSAGLQAGQAGFGRHGHVVLRSVTVIMSRRPGLPRSARLWQRVTNITADGEMGELTHASNRGIDARSYA